MEEVVFRQMVLKLNGNAQKKKNNTTSALQTRSWIHYVLNLKMRKSIKNNILKDIHSSWLIKTELFFFCKSISIYLFIYLILNEIYCKSISYLARITIWYSRLFDIAIFFYLYFSRTFRDYYLSSSMKMKMNVKRKI